MYTMGICVCFTEMIKCLGSLCVCYKMLNKKEYFKVGGEFLYCYLRVVEAVQYFLNQ